jgi:hypothetical protein
MKTFFSSVLTLAVCSLLLTACSFDGNMGSEYYSTAKQQVAAAGLDGKVIAGKMTSGNDFVTIEFDDITGDEMVKAATVLATMPIPANADRRIDWKSHKEDDLPNYLMFNTSTPNMDQISKYAQTWDAYSDNIVWATYNLNKGANSSPSNQPQMSIVLKDNTSKEDFKATLNYIKYIIGQPSQNKSVTNTAVDNPSLLFTSSVANVSILGVKAKDETDAVIDLAFDIKTIAEQKKSANANIKSYGVAIYNHAKEIGSDVPEFSISFNAEPKGMEDNDYKESNNFDLEVSQILSPKAQAIGYW